MFDRSVHCIICPVW